MNPYVTAYQTHRDAAHLAKDILDSWLPAPLPRVPGCSTSIRLAWRIECGRTIEEAAAREYLYRWALAIKPGDQVLSTLPDGRPSTRNPVCSVFGTPHTIGL